MTATSCALSVEHELDLPFPKSLATAIDDAWLDFLSGSRLAEPVSPLVQSSGLTNTAAGTPESFEAEWKHTVESLIERLCELQPGWDSYLAVQIDPELITDAKALASRLAVPGVPAPSVVPTVNGTIQIEWHTLKCDAEIEILENRRYHVFTMPVAAQAWEGELPLEEAVDRVKQVLTT